MRLFGRKPEKKSILSKKNRDSSFRGLTKNGDWRYLAMKVSLIYFKKAYYTAAQNKK